MSHKKKKFTFYIQKTLKKTNQSKKVLDKHKKKVKGTLIFFCGFRAKTLKRNSKPRPRIPVYLCTGTRFKFFYILSFIRRSQKLVFKAQSKPRSVDCECFFLFKVCSSDAYLMIRRLIKRFSSYTRYLFGRPNILSMFQ